MTYIPKINIRRTLLIAKRDFFGYVKTWGFWLSFFLPLIIIIAGLIISSAAKNFNFNVNPTRYETILDLTGLHADNIKDVHKKQMQDLEKKAILTLHSTGLLTDAQLEDIEDIYKQKGLDGLKQYIVDQTPITKAQIDKISDRIQVDMVFIKPPAKTLEALKPYLTGDIMAKHQGQTVKLNGALIITKPQSKIIAQTDPDKSSANALAHVEYWSENFNNPRLKYMAEAYFRNLAQSHYLRSGGLTQDGLNAAKTFAPFQVFNPSKSSRDGSDNQAVNLSDRLPFIVAGIMSAFLWLSVFSGSYMLLTSMLEEKLNKLLEMMLASVRFSEVITGKLIGVAAITALSMLPYILLSVIGIIGYIFFGSNAEIIAGLMQSFTPKIIIFFLIYLCLGYLFYGAFFISLGALSQSMQDAQTLTTPIVMILTLCVLIVPHGIENPDSPLLIFASFFPLSAPFAALIRLPSDPPLWELIISALFLGLITIGVIALASRLFRFGVLSGSGVDVVTAWFKRVIFRRKAG